MPRSAATRIETYLDLLDHCGAGFVEGVYLFGSLALGDYQEGQSDVDFVAVSAAPVDAASCEKLERVHEALRSQKGPAFDGVYLDPGRLARPPTVSPSTPCCRSGVFEPRGPGFDINPVTWHCLVQSGITIFGPSIATLGIPTDAAKLRAFLIDNLRSYWVDWIAKSHTALNAKPAEASIDAISVSWGVLGTSRIACTLATGRIVSKTDSGLWARNAFGTAWHQTIDDALAARRAGKMSLSIDRAATALDYMRHVIARSQTFGTGGR